MNKEDYVKIIKGKLKDNSKKIMLEQIDNYYTAKEYIIPKCNYSIGDDVKLKKGALLHGTYKNIDGLREIVNSGLLSTWIVGERLNASIDYTAKYPSSVGLWNLKQDYLLKDYINFYSGGTTLCWNLNDNKKESKVIPFNELSNFQSKFMNTFINSFISNDYWVWKVEQTKEARFLPSLVQDKVQIGVIFNSNNDFIKKLLDGDILNPNIINDEDVKPFVNPDYYERFIKERKNKDDFFTDRESAVLFGIPSNFIEGVLVGKEYENNKTMLKEIKELLPDAYICNLDGKVILT